MRRIATLFLLLTLLSCTISAQQLSGDATGSAFQGTLEVRFEEDHVFPKFIQFTPSLRLSPQDAITWMTLQFLLKESTSFELIRSNEDALGYSHHRYQQLENGYPVIGGVYILHSYQGFVQSMNGAIFQIPSGNSTPSVTPQGAIDKALDHLPATKYGWQSTHGGGINRNISEYPNPELVWVPERLDIKNGTFRLAYKMDIYALTPHHHRSWVYVDTQNGEVIAEEDRICHTNIEGTALTVYSGERSMHMDQVHPDTVRLRETIHGNGIITLDMFNQTEIEDAIDFTHPDGEWTSGTPLADRYGTDVHWAAQRYHDLLDSLFNRNSLNEEGLELISYVHVDDNWANATWNGSFARFGDGNPSSSLDKPLGTVDIVAHEFTHGLTQYTAGLIYAYESGALNESFSDLFGLATDQFARPEVFNWLIGTDATSNGNGIRSASNPNVHGDADTYQGEMWTTGTGDNGGVHSNSAVQNHWYYLLATGGEGVNDNGEAYVVEGIGWEKAIAIAYRNLAFYLTPFSDYDDAMYYGNLSAADLFGPCSQEYFSTVNAWHAVGLGQPIGEPVIAFQAQRFHCVAPDTIEFFNFSQPVQSVIWDFGDGNTSNENSPIHAYATEGTYDVSLIIESCSGTFDTLVKEDYIIIDPDALFCTAYIMDTIAVDTITACSGVILDPGGFDDYPGNANSVLVINPPSLGPIVLTFAEFRLRSNGAQDHLAIYDGTSIDAPQIGLYTGVSLMGQTIQSTGGAITLEFNSNANSDTTGFEVYYSIPEAIGQPIADYQVSTIFPLLNEPVQFTDQSENPGHYTYSFGDGTFSNDANPVHQYTLPGIYIATQEIVNCSGTDTKSIQIIVSEPGSLTLTPDSVCVTINAGSQYSGEITFANGGPGDLFYGILGENLPGWLNYQTQFGQLANSETATISFELDATGLVADTFLYYIPMQSGDTSQLNIEFPIKMIVLPFPQASFNSEIVDICNGLYQFTDETLNEPTSWFWNFGNGNTSTEENPEYQYPLNGAYGVSLIACNDLGCDTVSQENLIVINYCDTLNMAITGASLATNCNGLLFDDGGPDGDYSNDVDYITTIAPVGADYVTLTMNFFQIQPFLDFVYIYDGPDTLAPLLQSYSGFVASGTQVVSSGDAITLRFVTNNLATFKGFEIAWACGENLLPPTASFVAEEDNDCSNTWYFEGFPDGNYAYTWDFDDGFIATDVSSVTHHFTSAGTFNVTLDVTNAVGSSTFSQEITIASVPFDLDMTTSADTINLNDVITAQAILDISPASYSWIISTGDTLNTTDLSYMFTQAGNQTIYLEVTDDQGCSMWVEKDIFVRDIVGINELADDEVFLISPNPSKGQFNLTLKLNEANDLGMMIHNILGQRIYQERFGYTQSLDHDIQLSGLSGGVYFLSLYTKDRILAVRRIVIQ